MPQAIDEMSWFHNVLGRISAVHLLPTSGPERDESCRLVSVRHRRFSDMI